MPQYFKEVRSAGERGPTSLAELISKPVQVVYPLSLCAYEQYVSPYMQASVLMSDRHAFDAYPTRREYAGPWYRQPTDNSCAPTTLANAALILGRPLDEDLIQELVHKTDNIEPYFKGAKYWQLRSLVEARSSVRIVGERPSQIPELGPASIIGRTYPNSGSLKRFDQAHIKQAAAELGYWIITVIERGDIPLGAVESKTFYGSSNYVAHAICISGYDINERGHLNVQIVDPARGIFSTSIEHLTGNFLAEISSIPHEDLTLNSLHGL